MCVIIIICGGFVFRKLSPTLVALVGELLILLVLHSGAAAKNVPRHNHITSSATTATATATVKDPPDDTIEQLGPGTWSA